MFTGIVEGRRRIVDATSGIESLSLAVDLEDLDEGVSLGDSIAVRGCCLTVSELRERVARFHVMAETLGLTLFGSLRPGDHVNIERSLRVGDRLGGHFVSGHVDGLGTILERTVRPGQTDLEVEVPESLRLLVIPKGSICLDGVSLTLTRIQGARVSVALIPHTSNATTLGDLEVGSRVHLEMDMIGKWVRRFVEPAG